MARTAPQPRTAPAPPARAHLLLVVLAATLGLWLLVGLVGLLATGLAFAQARIASNARGESLSAYELQRLREGKPPLDR